MSLQKSTQNTITIQGIELHLFDPLKDEQSWIGQDEVMNLLIASWIKIHKNDRIMTPVLIGPPGSGKTTLARAAAKEMRLPVYMMNCTADIRPEDLLIMPVLSANQKIRYQASSLVSAMITGGVCILDEANRMNEKSWASLASLLDDRRYVDSITAGIRIRAHPDFRIVATMNEDLSVFLLPEFIESRLKPVLSVDYPSPDDIRKILKHQVPHAGEELTSAIIEHLTDKLTKGEIESFSIRDIIHITELLLKIEKNPHKITGKQKTIDSIVRHVIRIAE